MSELEKLKELIRPHIDFQHSYREDENRYPRDFWHCRVNLGNLSTDWISYGKQEEYKVSKEEKKEAEEVLTSLAIDIFDLFKAITEA